MSPSESTQFRLPESAIPTHWVNLLPDLPGEGLPPLHPGTKEPLGPDDLAPLFPHGADRAGGLGRARDRDPGGGPGDLQALAADAAASARGGSSRRSIPPPTSITSTRASRPPDRTSRTPPSRRRSTTSEAGVRKLATETGAGQWGSALALACQLFDLECEVFMVGRLLRPEALPPGDDRDLGRDRPPQPLGADRGRARRRPSTPSGSLGIAISEAVEVAARADDTNYSLGSVLNHVCLHQTVIGQEAIEQLELAGEYPDVVIGCVGGGSNFAGIAFPFIRANLREGKKTRFIAAEPAACPTLTRGVYRYDFGDTVGLTPLMPMYTLGHDFVPPPVHAGGLRYHGDAPIVCALVKEGMVEATADRARPRPSRRRSVRAQPRGSSRRPSPPTRCGPSFDEAEAAKQAGEERVILVNLCGHGHFDMSAYDAYLAGELTDLEFSEEEMERGARPAPRGAGPGLARRARRPARRRYRQAAPGQVTEWLKVRDWKSRGRCKLPRGFESHPVRCEAPALWGAGRRAGWPRANAERSRRRWRQSAPCRHALATNRAPPARLEARSWRP